MYKYDFLTNIIYVFYKYRFILFFKKDYFLATQINKICSQLEK